MKLKCTLAALAATTLAANAAITIATPANNNVVSTDGFEIDFTTTDTDLSVTFTAPHSAPLPSTIALQSFDFVAGATGGGYSGGSRYLAVFNSTTFEAASFVGASENTIDLTTGGALQYTFDDLSVGTAAPNSFYFVTWTDDPGADGEIQFSELTQAVGRMRMLTGNPLDDARLLNANGTTQNSDWDPAGTFNAVPEPSTALLGGLGLLALLRRRR